MKLVRLQPMEDDQYGPKLDQIACGQPPSGDVLGGFRAHVEALLLEEVVGLDCLQHNAEVRTDLNQRPLQATCATDDTNRTEASAARHLTCGLWLKLKQWTGSTAVTA